MRSTSASLPHRFPPWTPKLWTPQHAAAVVACFAHGASTETLAMVHFKNVLTCRVADDEMHLHYRSHSSNVDSERRESTTQTRGFIRRAILEKKLHSVQPRLAKRQAAWLGLVDSAWASKSTANRGPFAFSVASTEL